MSATGVQVAVSRPLLLKPFDVGGDALVCVGYHPVGLALDLWSARFSRGGPQWISEIKHDGYRLMVRNYMAADGARVFDHACRMGLEGIVCKRLDSPYRSGRSKAWIKAKNPRARRC